MIEFVFGKTTLVFNNIFFGSRVEFMQSTKLELVIFQKKKTIYLG